MQEMYWMQLQMQQMIVSYQQIQLQIQLQMQQMILSYQQQCVNSSSIAANSSKCQNLYLLVVAILQEEQNVYVIVFHYQQQYSISNCSVANSSKCSREMATCNYWLSAIHQEVQNVIANAYVIVVVVFHQQLQCCEQQQMQQRNGYL